MMEINMRQLYRVVLRTFELDYVTAELLSKVAAGSEKADDYEEILKRDKFFTELVIREASTHMRTSVVSSLSHGVVVVGQQKVRNMVLGHSLNRLFSPHADNNFQGFEAAEKNLVHALKAEEHARKCRNEWTGLAFAAGFMFDIFARWIAQEETYKEVLEPFFDSIWKQGLRTATLAWALSSHERVFISHRKIIFAAGLLHDLGKLGLALYEPREYSKCIERMKFDQDVNITDHGYEAVIEREHFDLSHGEIGSALVFQTKPLRDLELEVDFHHDSLLLKTRNPDAFLGAGIVNIADRLSWLMERKPSFVLDDLQEILRSHSEYFPLRAHDVMQLAAEIRAKGLLST